MKKTIFVFTMFAISVFAFGCEKTDTKPSDSAKSVASDDGHSADDHAGHDHAAHGQTGKHGGQLIELGRNHEYHAELVDDHATESIIIYMMDGHMEPLTVNQPTVSLVLTAGDNTKTFELTGNQPSGSSEFSSNDSGLMEMIDAEETKGKLRVTIDGKPFSGTIDKHSHDHG